MVCNGMNCDTQFGKGSNVIQDWNMDGFNGIEGGKGMGLNSFEEEGLNMHEEDMMSGMGGDSALWGLRLEEDEEDQPAPSLCDSSDDEGFIEVVNKKRVRRSRKMTKRTSPSISCLMQEVDEPIMMNIEQVKTNTTGWRNVT